MFTEPPVRWRDQPFREVTVDLVVISEAVAEAEVFLAAAVEPPSAMAEAAQTTWPLMSQARQTRVPLEELHPIRETLPTKAELALAARRLQ
jgi:hypothetical protein